MNATALRLLGIARAHLSNGAAMASSALLAFEDAEALYAQGHYEDAAARALTSLKYSVGIFHPAHTQAVVILDVAESIAGLVHDGGEVDADGRVAKTGS